MALSDTDIGAEAGGRAGEDGAYTVLARRYRPQTFDDLIGQDAMVQTLRNAFRTGRIAQAYMLTGVRGVGKTTTARIVARALNYVGPEGDAGPTVDMAEIGEHCAAIMESRHPDVLEIDAASHTGVENVREIIDSVRYRPAYARYKVYVIDEVHMLSKAAFNALLKTLEEPPEHVKFIFATTEIRKVPVTVLSRCQRFDLRRVDVELLRSHFKGIAEREGIAVDDQAVTLIARAAEGSVRDGLSILDQVMAHATGPVAAGDVRAMLGVAERTRVFDLLETVLKGDAGAALGSLSALYEDGAEPAQILSDMAEAVHVVTRIKAAGAEAADPTLSEAELARAGDLAGRLAMSVLARAWQMLLKGLGEVPTAPRPLVAAEMVLVRLAYAAELPPPDELIRRAGHAPAEREPAAPPPPGGTHDDAPSMAAPAAPVRAAVGAAAEPVEVPDIAAAPAPAALPEVALRSFEDVVALADRNRELQLCRALEEQVRLVRFRPGHIELRLLPEAPRTIANELGDRLKQWTGERWIVAVSEEEGEKTVGEVKRERRQQEREAVAAHPAVQAVFDQFPEAEIVDVRPVQRTPDEEA